MHLFRLFRAPSFLLLAMLLFSLPPARGMNAQQAAPVASTPAESGQAAGPEANSNRKKQEAEAGSDAFKKSPMVIKMGKALGMSPEMASAVFTWFNFLILAGAVLFGLLRALPKAFRNRTEGIQKNLVEARSATEEANQRLSGVEARLAKLDGEIAALRADAERDAAADEARIKATVEEEKQRILHAADQEISAAAANAERSLREFAARLAIEQAASRLTISAEEDHALVQQFAARLAGQGKGGAN